MQNKQAKQMIKDSNTHILEWHNKKLGYWQKVGAITPSNITVSTFISFRMGIYSRIGKE